MQPSPFHASEQLLAELGWVRSLAHSLVRDPGLAEDVVQEAWLLARQRPPRTLSARGIRAWLAQVTRTLARTRLRSDAARARREAEQGRPEASAPSTDEVVERMQLQQRLVAAVMALEEPYRSAVLLRHVDGLSTRELAARQGTSVANARQRVARGLALLRGRLDREHGGDGKAWVLALAPCLRDGMPLALASSLLGGLALVKSSLLAAVVLVAALCGYAGWRAAFAPSRAERLAVEAVAEPVAPLPSASEALAASTPRDGAEREAWPASASAAASSSASWTVRARLLDPEGAPLAGATLSCAQDDGERTAQAGADGLVELVLEARRVTAVRFGEQPLCAFRARAAAHRETVRYEAAPGGAVLELGELRLYPIGCLVGRVLDESGRPVAGAEVRLLPPLYEDPVRSRLYGPPFSRSMRRVGTSSDGRFRFDDVPVGAWRAWAGRATRAWAVSDVVRIEPSVAPEELALVLTALEESELVRGLVRGPEGPLAGVEVHALRAALSAPESYGQSDAQGRFVLPALPGVAYRLRTLTIPQRGLAAVEVAGVVAGAGEVVLEVPAARYVELELVAEGGARLGEVWARERHGVESNFARVSASEPGRGTARVLVPQEEFLVEVGGEDFASVQLGPFAPLAPPTSLRAVLHPLARVRGQVLAGGAPLAGARVQLMARETPGEVSFLYGFPTRLSGRDLRGTTSDAEGRFELPIPFAGSCALLAEKDGYAPTEQVLELGHGNEHEAVLELGAGGAVEGFVRVPADEEPAGIEVRLCRGDMRVHTTTTDAEGRYRLEHLAPGPYMAQARRARAGRAPGAAFGAVESVRDEQYRFPWVLEVRAGACTRHDLDLGTVGEAELRGVLRIDGAAPAGAVARLVPGEESWFERSFEHEEVALDARGEFDFGARRPQALVLVLEPGTGALVGTRVVAPLTLTSGATRFELALDSAWLSLRLPPDEDGPFALVGEPAPGVRTVTRLAPQGGRVAGDVPAGPLRLVGWRAGEPRQDPRAWSVLRTLDLGPGERRSFE